MTRDVLHLANDSLSVDVSRFGGSLLAASYRGVPFLKPTPTEGIASRQFGSEASFPLVPFGNRIEGNSFSFAGQQFALAPNAADPFCLHGDGWLAEWQVISQSATETMLRYIHHQNPLSPYAYEAIQTVQLNRDALTLSLTVTNTSEHALPFGLGHHPFFPRTPRTRLAAKATRFWSERAGHLSDTSSAIPDALDFATGNALPLHWINNAYEGWDGAARIEWPELGLRLALTTEGPFDCFMIYSPDADAEFFCFEPMTHLPNAHNMTTAGGLVPLGHGQSLTGRMTLSPATLPSI
jgi:aldose 1-epimerase